MAMTGIDLAKGYRAFKIEANALRKLRAAGYDDHVAFAEAHFPIGDAEPGNIAVVDTALGIVQGRMIYVMGPDGLGFLPISAARKFLKV